MVDYGSWLVGSQALGNQKPFETLSLAGSKPLDDQNLFKMLVN